MKTTIEVEGIQIMISHSEENISIVVTKDEEVIEEFTVSLSEEEETKEGDENIKDFGEFGGEEETDLGEEEEESQEEEEEVDDNEPKLESFQSFINKRK